MRMKMIGKMDRSFLIFFVVSMLTIEFGVHAGKSDGRFKYIKKPVSKYKIKTDSVETTSSSNDQMEKEEGRIVDENGEPLQQQETGDGDMEGEKSENAVGDAADNPASDTENTGLEGELPKAENEGHDEPNNENHQQGNEPVALAASGDENHEQGNENGNPASGDENPPSMAENPASGDESLPPAEGEGDMPESSRREDNGGENPELGGSFNSASTRFSLTDEGDPMERTTTRPTAIYTNELGEPVTNYTPSPKIYRMRRTSTTIINGRRIKIVNNRRGWNKQTILQSGD